MNEPARLREGSGPARTLLESAKFDVPSGSARRQALAFTTAAAAIAASSTAAAAGTTALVKSVVWCLCLGTIGGGAASFVVSHTIDHFDRAVPAAPAPSVEEIHDQAREQRFPLIAERERTADVSAAGAGLSATPQQPPSRASRT